MTERTWAGVEYQYFNDSEAAADTEYNEGQGRAPQTGALMVGCPACGIKLKKPRPVTFWPDGSPKCIMQ